MNAVAPRRLSLVPALPETDQPHLTVPVPRTPGDTPWRTQDGVAHVPAVLLLAAAGRCSCEDCCAVLARRLSGQPLSAV